MAVQKRSHEPLRVPENWRGQDRQMVIQLERILDDIYQKLGYEEFDPSEIEQEIADIQTSLDNKFDKSKVYNGLDKTASGFALDARQGPVLSGIFDKVQDAIAIIADGDTHVAISSGEYVYVKNNTHGLTDGLYKASANVAANGEISSSNMTADSKGGLNALKELIDGITPSVSNKNFETVSVANNTTTSLGSVTLNKGMYMLCATAVFAINSTGYRRINFATTNTGTSVDRYSTLQVGASNSDTTVLNLTWVVIVTSDSTVYYLNARQTSGGALNVTTPGVRVVKIA